MVKIPKKDFNDNDIKGNDLVFTIKDDIAYISHVNAVSGKGGGLIIFDLKTWQIIKNIDLKDKTFLKEIILHKDKVYITDPTRKAINIVDAHNYEITSVSMPDQVIPGGLAGWN